MSTDPMRLVKFVCVATAHATGRSDSAVTIHDGAWAFCASGGGAGHEWRPSDGLSLSDALRLTPRKPIEPAPAPTPAATRGTARPR